MGKERKDANQSTLLRIIRKFSHDLITPPIQAQWKSTFSGQLLQIQL